VTQSAVEPVPVPTPAPAPVQPAPASASEPPPWATDAAPAPRERGSGADQARRALVEEVKAEEQEPRVDPDEAVSFDDADVDAESGTDLLARELGAKMIEEIPHS
jgi:DNA polymerase-3 subunit gamma/tau